MPYKALVQCTTSNNMNIKTPELKCLSVLVKIKPIADLNDSERLPSRFGLILDVIQSDSLNPLSLV